MRIHTSLWNLVACVMVNIVIFTGARDIREAWQNGAVPVIHLDHGKASVDQYLRMFPEQFLASNKRVKPVDVRRIEHEDFIDYEIEFVELNNDEADTEEFIFDIEDFSNNSRDKVQNDNEDSESEEVNLVSFEDLNTVRSKQRARAGDIRRRRRIKLKRDPVRNVINDATDNQITEHKPDKNNFSHFTKSRTITRHKNLYNIPPETERKATVLDRRLSLQQRQSSLRSRKRIPLKFGRSIFGHALDKSSSESVKPRLRNAELFKTKTERSGVDVVDSRNVIKIRDDPKDDQGAEVILRHVTTSPLPVDMEPRQEAVHKTIEKQSDEHAPDRPETGDDDTEKLAANERHSTPTTPTPQTPPPALMMYPEVFTQQPDTSQIYKDVETPSLPPHLLTVFGSKPRSSRLQILPSADQPEKSDNNISWSVSSSVHPRPGIVSVFSSQSSSSTVSSALQFSIISTSTETSKPELIGQFEGSTPSDWSISSSTTTEESQGVHQDKDQSAAPSLKHKTDEVSTLAPHAVNAENEDVIVTTEANLIEKTSITADNKMMTTSRPHDDLETDESITSVYLHNLPKSDEMKRLPNTDIGSVNSITLVPFSQLTNQILDQDPSEEDSDDEHIFTVTPVYEAPTTMSPVEQSIDHETTTFSPSVLALMYSGQYHEDNPGQYQDHWSQPQQGGHYQEGGHYQDGQYHEVNPGQYHEVNPGQYHEANPGQYHEVNPGQYTELSPGQYLEEHHDSNYQNLDKTYPNGDYEVNEVKVDFEREDEHKIYNVQAKAGDFIIGEVGKIDVNNGQTVEGVRYTALEGEVDPLRIAEILNMYFGTRTS